MAAVTSTTLLEGASSRVESGLKEHLKAEEMVSGSGVDGALAALHVAHKVRAKTHRLARSVFKGECGSVCLYSARADRFST